MGNKTYIREEEMGLLEGTSQIGATIEALAKTIASRHDAGPESYTWQLLHGKLDSLLKKVSEESLETALAAKEVQMLDALEQDEAICDAAIDHLRYEAGDVFYHMLVLLDRFGISTDELAAELNSRMTDDEAPAGCVRLKDEHIKRGK